MSAPGSAERIGMLERLTSSTAFAVLFGLATLVLTPILLLGFAMVPLWLPIAFLSHAPYAWALSLLPLGGAAGFIGLFLTTRLPKTVVGNRIMMFCIAAGIATAILMIADPFIQTGSAVTTPDSPWFLALYELLLAIPILAALGRIAKVWRLRAAAEGRAQDALPLIFFAVALGELACAIAISAGLAMG